MLETLFTGLPEFASAAYAALRVAVGVFFAISGFHKLFNKDRHASLVRTLRADGVPLVRVNQWFVPGVELSAGLALIVGLLVPLASLGLLVICLVACAVDGLARVRAMEPLNWADALDDVLYLPETVYAGALLLFVIGGAGPLSLDALIWGMLQ